MKKLFSLATAVATLFLFACKKEAEVTPKPPEVESDIRTEDGRLIFKDCTSTKSNVMMKLAGEMKYITLNNLITSLISGFGRVPAHSTNTTYILPFLMAAWDIICKVLYAVQKK